ncbi:hypothetical protein T492DRAFT_1150109 [Pavlovales sp. CCMP2436]|nr:hypothetical protein T492DRAFT_1150109 [Pavlovales sp. CCMP2436]
MAGNPACSALLLALCCLVGRCTARSDVSSSSLRTSRTAVVVLGYDPRGLNWERVVWGDRAAGLLGRVPQGVAVAVSLEAELLVLGSGEMLAPGERARVEDPVALLGRRLPELAAFGGDLARLPDLRERLLPRCLSECFAQNTRAEIESGLRLCASHGIDQAVFVSSPTHVARCSRDASALLEAHPDLRGVRVFVCPSGTSYTNEGAESVAIVEPLHRACDPADEGGAPPLHRLVARALRLNAGARRRLCVRLAQLLLDSESEPAALSPPSPDTAS